MERGTPLPHYPPHPSHKGVPTMVVTSQLPEHRSVLGNTRLDSNHHGRQSPGLGRDMPEPTCTGPLVSGGGQTPHKHTGTPGCQASTSTLVASPTGRPGKSSKRQRHHGCIHQPSGRDAQRGSTERGTADPQLGRAQLRTTIRNSHPRSVQHKGGLPQSQPAESRRMGTSPGSLRGDHQPLGNSPDRLNGIQGQLQSTKVLLPLPRPNGGRSGRHDSALALRAGICLPSTSNATPGPEEDQAVTSHGDSHSTILASKNLVLGPPRNVNRSAAQTHTQKRPPSAGADTSSQPRTICFDGMAVEAAIWQRQGLTEEVITTMLKARKSTSSRAYYRVWRAYFTWCAESNSPPLELHIPRVLSFLQRGLQSGLKLSSLKVQVSALSILLQSRLALNDTIRTFLQGVAHVVPPFRPPTPAWDLNLVLEALLEPPFEPLDSISDIWLTWKTVFLTAISSARRVCELGALSCAAPFLIFHKDKAVLRTIPSYLPKVVSSFHVNQEIVVPSLCPEPKNDKERRLHSLDVVRALRKYTERTRAFRRCQSLFVIPSGPRRGQAASKTSIARWITEAIRRAYLTKGKPLPKGIRAHSTRAIGASWAWHNSASLDQICKAATWSSVHTFTKFYRIDTFASAEASFGRKVLHAVVQ
uniref:Tyr recombinase domain-containing protein n=1 Tax=Xenopus tropicalis TaxID=8364 RepID=A0A6I8RZ83_XENTR